MPRIHPYWLDDHDAPYATLLRTIDTYCNPAGEDEDAYDDLINAARRQANERMIRFKQELREVVRDPAVLPEGALSTAADYDDGSDGEFLARLWRDLYGDDTP